MTNARRVRASEDDEWRLLERDAAEFERLLDAADLPDDSPPDEWFDSTATADTDGPTPAF